MENKTSYTLQEAKEAIALKNNDQFSSWQSIRSNASCTVFEILSDEAAELYKSKATEELRKENEFLHETRKKLNEVLDIHYDQAKLQKEEIERLKESNKELVDALKEHLPKDCVEGWDEVKFCPTRQGDGGKCQWCKNGLDQKVK